MLVPVVRRKIIGAGTQIFVEPGLGSRQFDTDILTVTSGGELDMTGGIAHIDATADFDDLSRITGNGLISFQDVPNTDDRLLNFRGSIVVDGAHSRSKPSTAAHSTWTAWELELAIA